MKELTVKEFARLGGLARAKKLGKKGLSEANTKAIAARWAAYYKKHPKPVVSGDKN